MLFAFLAVSGVTLREDENVSAQTPETVNICDRTPMIEFAILEIIKDLIDEGTLTGDNPDCDAVPTAHLAAIEALPLPAGGRISRAYASAGGKEMIRSQPTASDLSGLTGLMSVNMSGHELTALPSGFFSDNTGLTSVDLSVSQIRSLPGGLFDDLTQLHTLRLERNYFTEMPDALSAETMAKLTNLQTFTLGLDVPWESWHFVDELPSGWVESLSTNLENLELRNIRITDTEADWIGENLTKLVDFQFDYQDMSFGQFIELLAAFKTNSADIGGFDELHMTSSSDALDGCASGSGGGSLGNWYAEHPTQIAAFKTALTDLKVEQLKILDPTMTATAVNDILDSIDDAVLENIHLECGNLSGFTGESFSDFETLMIVRLQSVGLTNDDFIAIVSNLGDTRIQTLSLGGNRFDKGSNYVDLTQFDFSGILDTLSSLDYAPYDGSCEGPWIADYEAAGFDLSSVNIKPDPKEEPEECVEPEEEENWKVESEHNWPRAIIMRIEPVVPVVRMWTGDNVVLSTNVYGLQNILDNNLADAMPPEKVWFVWGEEERNGDFTEFTIQEIRKNGRSDDREVRFYAPDTPGIYRIKANVPHAAMCKKPRLDKGETAAEAVARCTAEFEIKVRRQRDYVEETIIPKNPSGPIPSSIMNTRGNQCPVFTPEEGGELIGDDYSVYAQPGAIENDSYIAICMDSGGPASNAGLTHQRYTLNGDQYDISGYDASGQIFTNYRFQTYIEACIPLPDELRNQFADVELIVINPDRSLTSLPSKVTYSSKGAQVCGPVSSIPSNIAVGIKGAPGPLPTPEIKTPDTGGGALERSWVLLLLVLGLTVAATSVAVARIARRSH